MKIQIATTVKDNTLAGLKFGESAQKLIWQKKFGKFYYE